MTANLALSTDKSKSKLALNGGKPVSEILLPYGRQSISEQDLKRVRDILQSDWLTQGPEIEQFEKAVARFIGVKYAVAFSSGTTALHGAYTAAGLKPNKEVLLAPITFAATGNAALYLDATPVYVDIEPGNIDAKTIEQRITIAKKYKLTFIIDAAHSLGGKYKGKHA